MKRVYLTGNKYDNAKSAKQIMEAIADLPSIELAGVIDRNRPYKGQRHTDDGERGKTLIQGLTMRDVRDCFILALYDSAPTNETLPMRLEADIQTFRLGGYSREDLLSVPPKVNPQSLLEKVLEACRLRGVLWGRLGS